MPAPLFGKANSWINLKRNDKILISFWMKVEEKLSGFEPEPGMY
jgi:hypothetical protein